MKPYNEDAGPVKPGYELRRIAAKEHSRSMQTLDEYLQRLLDQGVARERINVDHRHDVSYVVVDGRRVAEFRAADVDAPGD